MVSSTAKGDKLEDQVFALLPQWVKKGLLAVSTKQAEYKRMAVYHSSNRNGPIKFENCVECYAPGSRIGPNANPGLVLIFECKSRGRKVDIGVVEELSGRLTSGLGFRPKGFIVSDAGYTATAISSAKANGIGLIRIMPDDQIDVVLYFMTPEVIARLDREFPLRAKRGLTVPEYRSEAETVYATYGGYVFGDVADLVKSAIEDDQSEVQSESDRDS